MKVLIACECSGIVRESFAALGHDAWSVDIQPSERPGQHIQGDVLTVLDRGWDLMIAHPPCTYLSRVSMPWYVRDLSRQVKAQDAMQFFMALWAAPIPFIAVENPYGLPWQWFRKPDQVIQPWQFGHPMTKATCLWLKQLPPLLYTSICADPFVDWSTKGHHGTNKAKSRSRTFTGIASAMAIQWSEYIKQMSATA
jgi:hypothetical protein